MKKKIDAKLITHVALLREGIIERNKKILKLYKMQLQDVATLNNIMCDYRLEGAIEEWYLDVVDFMSSIGIKGSNDRFKTT
tara:strand:- start:3036 stop:3278 length:243 start_codon:yes stop_codon:yes gene_type:complete